MVSAFFDMAELKAEMHEPMYMRDWLQMLDRFTQDFSLGVLEGAGSVSHEEAAEHALGEYEAYHAQLPDELSAVERAYLDELKAMQRRLKESGGQ